MTMRSHMLMIAISVSLCATVARADGTGQVDGVSWPDSWIMFGPVSWDCAGQITPEALREIPERLELGGETLEGREVQFENGRLNIGALLDRFERQDTVFLFGEMTAERPMDVMLGAGADWWMAWWLNGEPLFDTLDSGNLGQEFSVNAHSFEASLRQGANVIVARVSAGREGFLLAAGMPALERWEHLRQVGTEEERRQLLAQVVSEAVAAAEAGERARERELLGEALGVALPGEHIELSLRLRMGESYERDGQAERASAIYQELLAGELPAWAIPVVQRRLEQTR